MDYVDIYNADQNLKNSHHILLDKEANYYPSGWESTKIRRKVGNSLYVPKATINNLNQKTILNRI